METPSGAPVVPETIWRRWWRKLAALEVAMDLTYDDLQDRRMDRIESELAELRSHLSLQSGSSNDAQP